MLDENPYASPLADGPTATDADRERLRKVAAAQRQVNLAVLFYLCLIPLNLGMATIVQQAPWAGIVYLAIALGVLVYGAFAVFRLASLFYSGFVAVLCVIALLIPLIGLLILVAISSKATSLLKQHGIRVGLLGADPNSI